MLDRLNFVVTMSFNVGYIPVYEMKNNIRTKCWHCIVSQVTHYKQITTNLCERVFIDMKVRMIHDFSFSGTSGLSTALKLIQNKDLLNNYLIYLNKISLFAIINQYHKFSSSCVHSILFQINMPISVLTSDIRTGVMLAIGYRYEIV